MRQLWGKVKEMEWNGEMEVRKRWKVKKREMTSRRNEIKRTAHTQTAPTLQQKKEPFQLCYIHHTHTHHDLGTRQSSGMNTTTLFPLNLSESLSPTVC